MSTVRRRRRGIAVPLRRPARWPGGSAWHGRLGRPGSGRLAMPLAARALAEVRAAVGGRHVKATAPFAPGLAVEGILVLRLVHGVVQAKRLRQRLGIFPREVRVQPVVAAAAAAATSSGQSQEPWRCLWPHHPFRCWLWRRPQHLFLFLVLRLLLLYSQRRWHRRHTRGWSHFGVCGRLRHGLLLYCKACWRCSLLYSHGRWHRRRILGWSRFGVWLRHGLLLYCQACWRCSLRLVLGSRDMP